MNNPPLRHPAAEPSLWLTDKPLTLAVAGDSMLPFLREGDRLTVVRARREDLVPGRVVIFRRGAEVVAHRLLAVHPDRFLEKGDAQGRGNWWPWPEDMGVAVALQRGEERVDLSTTQALGNMAMSARAHLRTHRVAVLADQIPWDLPRRAFLKVSRLLAPRES